MLNGRKCLVIGSNPKQAHILDSHVSVLRLVDSTETPCFLFGADVGLLTALRARCMF